MQLSLKQELRSSLNSNLKKELKSKPQSKLTRKARLIFLLYLLLQVFVSPAFSSSNVKYYLKCYDSVKDDDFKLKQEKLEVLIAEVKSANKKDAKAAPPLLHLLRTLMYLQLERGDGNAALKTSDYIIEKIAELCSAQGDLDSTLQLNHLERAKAYLVLRRPEEALDELAVYKRGSPFLSDPIHYNPELDYLEAWAKFQQGDKKSALELIGRIFSSKNSSNYTNLISRAHSLSSRVYAAEGDNDRALDEANKALNLRSDTLYSYTLERALALSARAIALVGSKRIDSAIADAEKAIELNPDLKEGYLALAMALKEKNEKEKSLQALDKCLAIDSGLPAALVLRKNLNQLIQSASTGSEPGSSNLQNSTNKSDSERKSPIRDKWALVIGISKFQNPKLNLKYADKDAQDFKDYLVNDGHFSADHVKLLLNENASREEILKTLGDSWLPHVVLPGDLVVIYMSTHGSPSSFDVKGVNYLVAHDTKVDSLYATGIAIQDLVRIIKGRINTDRIVMILDACHSGSAEMPGGKGIVRAANVDAAALLQGVGQIVVASSDINQRSWEFKNKPNGVFTYYLIESLRKAGKYGNLLEAFNSAKEQVQAEVLKERGVLQKPVLKSKWTDDKLELAVPAAEPRKGI